MINKRRKTFSLTRLGGEGRQVHSGLQSPVIGAVMGRFWVCRADKKGPQSDDGRGLGGSPSLEFITALTSPLDSISGYQLLPRHLHVDV